MKRTVKILITLLAVAAILLSFAACGKNKTEEPAEDALVVEDGQNPVMNYIGDYASDRCTIHVEADGDTDAKISVDWANSAFENVHWTMSGLFDVDTQRVNYSNSTKTVTSYDSDGNIEKEDVEYSNGSGRIQFYNDGTLAWQDELEADALAGMTFTFVPSIDDVIASAAATSEAASAAADTTASTTAATTKAATTAAATTKAATTAAATSAASNDGQNSVMNFVGTYADTTAGRCTIEITADGDTDAKISVHWGSSASESSNWTMSGRFDPDTLRINYSNGVKTNLVFDDNGNETSSTVEYKNGFGRIQFYNDGTLAWQDELEADNVAGMTFALVK